MANSRIHWSLQFTNGFKKSFQDFSERDRWRVTHVLGSIIHVKEPTTVYQHTPCKKCPPDFYLLGISDDGLGNKGIEVQIWIQREQKIIWFLKCRKAIK